MAAINYAAVDKGQTYRIDGALNSGMTVITKAGDEGYSDIISYGEISRSDAKLTVNYVDEEGISLKNSETLRVKFDKGGGRISVQYRSARYSRFRLRKFGPSFDGKSPVRKYDGHAHL